MAAREAYSLYVERAVEGANEADGPLSSLLGEALFAAGAVVLLVGRDAAHDVVEAPFPLSLSRPLTIHMSCMALLSQARHHSLPL